VSGFCRQFNAFFLLDPADEKQVGILFRLNPTCPKGLYRIAYYPDTVFRDAGFLQPLDHEWMNGSDKRISCSKVEKAPFHCHARHTESLLRFAPLVAIGAHARDTHGLEAANAFLAKIEESPIGACVEEVMGVDDKAALDACERVKH